MSQRSAVRFLFAAVVAVAAAAVVGAQGNGGAADTRDAASVVHAPSDFSGLWDYNADQSLNVLTGRPEQRPRSATLRGGVPVGPLATPARSEEGGRGSRDGRVRLGAANGIGPTPAMMRESRDLARDLLEVPETLQIDVGDGTITITDDLERSRTYTTDGRKERQQIAASRFDVRTSWVDGQLRQEISGAFDFRLTQTYFLSPDGDRLFVILRVGEPRDDEPQAGYDRVYDRISP